MLERSIFRICELILIVYPRFPFCADVRYGSLLSLPSFLPIEGVSSIENTKGTTHRTNSQRCPISNCGSSANIGRVSDLWRTKCAGLGLTHRGCVSCRQGSVNLEPFFEAWNLICNRRKGRSENEWCYEGVHAEALSEYY